MSILKIKIRIFACEKTLTKELWSEKRNKKRR